LFPGHVSARPDLLRGEVGLRRLHGPLGVSYMGDDERAGTWNG
jgi:hypothetical protein